MVIVIFRSRLSEGVESEYSTVAMRMEELAKEMPGFVSIKTFEAADGERVLIVEFESERHSEAWRRHPEHLEAQRLGRERFYSEFRIQVCSPVRQYGFKQDAARP